MDKGLLYRIFFGETLVWFSCKQLSCKKNNATLHRVFQILRVLGHFEIGYIFTDTPRKVFFGIVDSFVLLQLVGLKNTQVKNG